MKFLKVIWVMITNREKRQQISKLIYEEAIEGDIAIRAIIPICIISAIFVVYYGVIA